jgi:hypothetical protein
MAQLAAEHLRRAALARAPSFTGLALAGLAALALLKEHARD